MLCAVNPSCVGKTFDDAIFCEIVDTISNGRDCLLENVNFNVEVRIHIFMSLLTDMPIRANNMGVLGSLLHC